jgi:hypothetical protein
MATNSPVIVGKDWVLIYFGGDYSGAIQNLGNAPLIGCVWEQGEGDPVPPEGRGGFAIYSQPIPIALSGMDSLFVRSTADVGCVVLA